MYYIGVDLGGTNIAVGIVDESGNIIKKMSTPTMADRKDEEIIKDLALLCVKIVEESDLKVEDIHSIGVGSPGTCDFDQGIIVYANNIKMKNTPIRQEIQKYIQVPVYVENDANCAAFGESVAGACKGYKDSITVTLGTGVGGGTVVDHKILRGAYFGGGELGHQVIVCGGEQCTCGRKGCWEAYSSVTGLIKSAKAAVIANPNTLILQNVNNNLEEINGKVIYDAFHAGDAVAKQIIDDYIYYLAEGITNLINIFEPEIIAIGGGLSAQGDALLKPLVEQIGKSSYGGNLKTKIVIASLGNDAGIIGAAMLGKSVE